MIRGAPNIPTSLHPYPLTSLLLGGRACVMRFDQIELESVPFEVSTNTEPAAAADHAPRLKRLAALLIDLSLFAALALALSPLLPSSRNTIALGALAGFVVVVSYYYFVGTWML